MSSSAESQSAAAFGSADADDDGRVSCEEWMAASASASGSAASTTRPVDGSQLQSSPLPPGVRNPNADDEQLRAAFKRADVDGDGYVSRDEWRIAAAFQAIDTDGDGRITRAEWLKARADSARADADAAAAAEEGLLPPPPLGQQRGGSSGGGSGGGMGGSPRRSRRAVWSS